MAENQIENIHQGQPQVSNSASDDTDKRKGGGKGLDKKVSLSNLLDALLKTPEKLVFELQNKKATDIVFLSACILIICMMVYGAVNGLFSGGTQVFFASMKFSFGLAISGFICLPSLYIFLALSGYDIKPKDSLGILTISLTVFSIILVGFSPVLWIFSQSTESLVFIGILNFIFALVSLKFCVGLLLKSVIQFSGENPHFIKVWVVVFLLVLTQMTTTLRPIIGTSDAVFTSEKKFFITHWAEQFDK